MKKLSTYLLLVLFSFSNLVHADDVRDFEIEGISIGDSALDFFTKSDIDKSVKEASQYPNDEYKIAFILKPITIDAIKKVADNNETMPPKSTYVEPKLRSGLTIYPIE